MLAAPAWTAFMNEVYKRKPAPPDWPMPAGIVTQSIDVTTNMLWTQDCGGVQATEFFIPGTEPTQTCCAVRLHARHDGSVHRVRRTLAHVERRHRTRSRRIHSPAPSSCPAPYRRALDPSGSRCRAIPLRRDSLRLPPHPHARHDAACGATPRGTSAVLRVHADRRE